MSDKERKLLIEPLELTALAAVLILLHLSSLYSYLFFHSLVEILRIAVIFAVFVLAWHSRRWSQNSYLTFVGISYLFIGSLELLHTLAYKGMGVFQGYDANLPTQLWIAFRYLESISLIVAAFFIDRRMRPVAVFCGYSLITTALAIGIFRGAFPDCFVEGEGLTTFKIGSEYAISGLFLVSIFLLMRKSRSFERGILSLLVLSLVAAVGAEIAFTQYVSVYGPANEFGHYLLLLSTYCVYRAVLVTGIVNPFSLLFRGLKLKEEELEARVADRTAALAQSEERFRVLVEQAPEAIVVFDFDLNRIVDVNANAEKLFGCGRIDLLKHGPQHFYPPTQPDQRPVMETFREHCMQALAGQTVVFERQIRNAGGKDLVCEVRLNRLPSADKKILRSSFIDITERARAERELRESEEKFSAAFQATPDAIAITRFSDGIILEVNEGYSQLLGYSRDEFDWKNHRRTFYLGRSDGPRDLHRQSGEIRPSHQLRDEAPAQRRRNGDRHRLRSNNRAPGREMRSLGHPRYDRTQEDRGGIGAH